MKFFHQFVLAQIQEPSLPESISCGPFYLPSVLKTSELVRNIWQICISYYLTRILSLFYVLALFLGVIFIAWAGILYITQPEKTKEIHRKLFYGVLGVVVAILSLTIVKIIETFFLNL